MTSRTVRVGHRGGYLLAGVLSLAGLALATGILHAKPGDLDPSFGNEGIVVADFPGRSADASGVAIQGDGKIVVAGSAFTGPAGGPYDIALLRYNGDGTPDGTFGAGGRVITDLGTDDAFATAIAVQPDGRILVAGGVGDFPNSDFLLLRYTNGGDLDPTFGTGGTASLDFGVDDWALDLAIQSDGQIIVAGVSLPASVYAGDLALARYNGDGTLDAAFGAGGAVLTDLGGHEHALGVTLQGDGKIVVVGNSSRPEPSLPWPGPHGGPFLKAHAVVVRYLADGTRDATFGTDGTTITDFASRWGAYNLAVAMASGGKILTVGAFLKRRGATSEDFLLARYASDGRVDGTFGDEGSARVSLGGGGGDYAAAVAIQADERIVAAGHSGLVRYTTQGRRDRSFAHGGRLRTDPRFDIHPTDVRLQDDGAIVVVGGFGEPVNDVVVLRILP